MGERHRHNVDAGWIDCNGELEQHVKPLDLPRLEKRGNRILKSINDSGGIPVTGKIQHQEVKFDYGQVQQVGLEEAATEILENKKVQKEIGDFLKKKLK